MSYTKANVPPNANCEMYKFGMVFLDFPPAHPGALFSYSEKMMRRGDLEIPPRWEEAARNLQAYGFTADSYRTLRFAIATAELERGIRPADYPDYFKVSDMPSRWLPIIPEKWQRWHHHAALGLTPVDGVAQVLTGDSNHGRGLSGVFEIAHEEPPRNFGPEQPGCRSCQ